MDAFLFQSKGRRVEERDGSWREEERRPSEKRKYEGSRDCSRSRSTPEKHFKPREDPAEVAFAFVRSGSSLSCHSENSAASTSLAPSYRYGSNINTRRTWPDSAPTAFVHKDHVKTNWIENNHTKKIPYNFMNFVETLLGWDLKWEADFESRETLLSPLFNYPDIVKIVQTAHPYHSYRGYEQFKFAYIPRLLTEGIQFMRSCPGAQSVLAKDATTLFLKEFEEMGKYYLITVKTEIQREGPKARLSEGDLVILQFNERDDTKHLGLVATVNSYEDHTNKTMSGNLLHVIDEYTIRVKSNLRHHLEPLKGNERDFEVSVVCNIKSLLFRASSCFDLIKRGVRFQFLKPETYQGRILRQESLKLNRRLFGEYMRRAIEYGVGFIRDAIKLKKLSNTDDAAKIFCLTSDDEVSRSQVAQEIVSNSLRFKPVKKLLIITAPHKLEEWKRFLKSERINSYALSETFVPIKEQLKELEKNDRRQVLEKELFEFEPTQVLPKPRIREKLLDEVVSWVEGSSVPVSSYTSLLLERLLERKRAEMIRRSLVVLGTYKELMTDRTFEPLLHKHGLWFECCLADEADRLPELDALCLLFHPINKLLLIGSELPFNQRDRRLSLLERFTKEKCHLSF